MWDRLCAAAVGRETSVAVGNEDLFWTFGELVQRAEAAAGSLAGAGRPLRVGVALPGGPEFTALQFGCLRAGALFVPMPVLATEREARHYLALAEVDLLVADPDTSYRAAGAEFIIGLEALCAGQLAGRLEDHRKDLGEDSRLLQFTSGSTGRPQGILLTEANLLANLHQAAAHLETVHEVFCLLPQFHAMGGAVGLESLCHGSAVLFANRFDPASGMGRMAMCRHLVASPNFVRMMLRLGVLSAATLPDLDDITLGSAVVSQALVADLRAKFPDARIHLRYGLSEAVGALTLLTLEPGEVLQDAGDVGPPLEGVELEIREGELWVRAGSVAARSIFAGRVEPLVDEQGFLATGDLAAIVGGHVHLGGRRSTYLKVHGYRIDPGEIEAVLLELPGIAEVVVLGLPDAASGERIVACVERSVGAAVTDDALWDVCRAGLSAHKYPARIVGFDSLPRTPAGKLDRPAVRQMIDP